MNKKHLCTLLLTLISMPFAAAKELSIEKEWQRSSFALRDPKNSVINTPVEWQKLWEGLEQKAPAVDFNKFTALACVTSAGSGGVIMDILSIREEEDHIVVKYTVLSPGDDRMASAVMNSPYHIVLIKKSSKKVTFENKE